MSVSSRSIQVASVVVLIVLAGCLGGAGPADPSTTPTAESTAQPTATAEGTLEVHFINVGQSVSTLVVGPTGETMLIDTGHYNDDGEYVLSYLKAHDIDQIDYLVVSHNDADHIGGNAAIIEYYETQADGIGAIYDPGIAASTQTYESYLDAVEEHDVTLYQTREGDTIPFEGATVDVFGPPDPYLEDEERNENSIVLKLTHGQTSLLFTGDAEDDQEQYLIDTYGAQLNSTVMKAGHHGSSSSTSGAILDAADPQAVIISSAYDSQYGHPTDEVLTRLSDRSIPAFWTATHGNIVLVSDGQGVSVQTQTDAPTTATQLKEGSPIEPGMDGEVTERVRYGGTAVTAATSTAVTDGGTPTGQLEITEINADAEGDDGENLNDEYVVFENTGDGPLDIGGWTVSDEAGKTYTVPSGVTLEAGSQVTLHTGSGEDTATDLYWGQGSPVWNNGGDTVIVRNSDGDIVREEQYDG
ncbi:lamin tail domain-containing protein [Salinirubrum litoreum]|uniref:Lamin tail domain-containing protein n=1 Tax=Salinirubrum litoreum TaxID=1126234 RepID=A0ABD5RB59_9EURY|nr:lamin tail domain-containing protein [Salinirubrum litoreum]